MTQKQCKETVYYGQANDLGRCGAEGQSLRVNLEMKEGTSEVDIHVGPASRAFFRAMSIPNKYLNLQGTKDHLSVQTI